MHRAEHPAWWCADMKRLRSYRTEERERRCGSRAEKEDRGGKAAVPLHYRKLSKKPECSTYHLELSSF